MAPRPITRDFKQTFPAHCTAIYVSVVYWWRRMAFSSVRNAVFVGQKLCFHWSKT